MTNYCQLLLPVAEGGGVLPKITEIVGLFHSHLVLGLIFGVIPWVWVQPGCKGQNSATAEVTWIIPVLLGSTEGGGWGREKATEPFALAFRASPRLP